ncbi:V/A-type H+/Na+-transporting ATPase subunit D [Gammaproteobacteria bacterium]
MSQRLKVPPTKSSLLALRRQENFLQEGYTLLERKRDLLTRLVYERLNRYRRLRIEVRDALVNAYRWLAIIQLRMGSRSLHQAALGSIPALQVNIFPRSSLGVEYPAVSAELRPLQPVGLMGTDASFDEARDHLARLTIILANLGEAEMALRRMLAEQRKTQKRVNALKYNVIPRYQATIHFIQSSLEEEERNTLFQTKLLCKQDVA